MASRRFDLNSMDDQAEPDEMHNDAAMGTDLPDDTGHTPDLTNDTANANTPAAHQTQPTPTTTRTTNPTADDTDQEDDDVRDPTAASSTTIHADDPDMQALLALEHPPDPPYFANCFGPYDNTYYNTPQL